MKYFYSYKIGEIKDVHTRTKIARLLLKEMYPDTKEIINQGNKIL